MSETKDKEEFRQVRGHVVDLMCELERRIDVIIGDYLDVSASKRSFVQTILLNPMMVTMGAKVKILRHLIAKEKWPNIDSESMGRLLNVRNQFAHSVGRGVISLRVNVDDIAKSEDSDDWETEILGTSILLETVSGSGVYSVLDFREAFETFNAAYQKVHGQLMATRKAQLNSEDGDAEEGL